MMRAGLLTVVIVMIFSFGFFRRARARFGNVITVGGLERTYQFYAPTLVRANQPTSLVIALHGGGGRGRGMRRLTGFDALADQKGFLVAYPDGLNRQWNDSRAFIQGRTQADDVAFIEALIA
jgi:polyhydroxybutyrate depolymerase